MRGFLAAYSSQFDHINEDIVRNIRLNDNMVEKIEEICIELTKSLQDNNNVTVKYLGCDFDDSKNRFREANASKKKDSKTGKFQNVQYVNVNPTFSRMAVFHLYIKYQDPRTKEVSVSNVDMPIYIPQFIDDYHYYIRGNKYSAPYQLTDAITYLGRNDSIILKTLTRAIKLSREAKVIKDVHGLEYKTYVFYTHVSTKKIPFLLYYFAYYGFFVTLRYFGLDKLVRLFKECPIEPDDDTVYFKFGKLFLGINRFAFNAMYELRQFVCTILQLQRKNLDLEYIRDTYYWRWILGANISSNKSHDNGKDLLLTFLTCLDRRTIENIKNIIGGPFRSTSFAVLRWMFKNYSSLSNKNTSLQNKRLRYSEYIVAPLIRDMQGKLYRFLKTSVNMRDKKRLLDIFKPSPSIIVHAIIGKTKNKNQVLSIAKYSNQVNDMAIFTALKYTRAGPGTAIEKIGKRAGISYRLMDTTYAGNVDLITTSAGSVGISGVLTPYAEVDGQTLAFKLD
jgi:hypothetical protein